MKNFQIARHFLTAFFFAGLAASICRGAPQPGYWSWAKTPPMGWNSWDGFATTVTEAQTRAQADFMAASLRRHGWQYIVVDIQWYEPNTTGFDYHPGAKLQMDQWGRSCRPPINFLRQSTAKVLSHWPIMSITLV